MIRNIGRRRSFISFALCLLLLIPLSHAAAQDGGQADERRPSWIERLFGGGEREPKAAAKNQAEDAADESAEDAEADDSDSEKANERASGRERAQGRDAASAAADSERRVDLEKREEARSERAKAREEMARERAKNREELARKQAKSREELAREQAKREATDAREAAQAEAERRRKFSEEEREVLEGWQRGEARGGRSDGRLPPGLQKKVDRGGELPPGWKRKIEIGTVLDDEIEANAESLPAEILRRLPEAANQDTEIMRIGDEIVRVMEDSREIVDILSRRGQ